LVTFGAPRDATVAAFDINDRSQVVGFYYSRETGGHRRAFYWDRCVGWKPIGPFGAPGELLYSQAFDISPRGLVAGGYVTTRGESRIFVWDARRGGTDLGAVGGALAGSEGVNAQGRVVVSNGTVVTRRRNQLRIAAPAGRVVHGEGINTRGAVVGETLGPAGDTRAFVWTPRHGLTDLGPADGPVQDSYDTVFVNDRGQVAVISEGQARVSSRR
jgi:probable HAF family extracellular repeat protein